MRLTGDEFDAWTAAFYEGRHLHRTWGQVSEDAHVPLVSLATQRRKNAVDLDILVRVTRHHGGSPLEELRRIQRVRPLIDGSSRPSCYEVTASLHPAWALMELAARSSGHLAMDFSGLNDDPSQYQYRFATWVDITTGKRGRPQLQAALGGSESRVVRRLRGTDTFALDEILRSAGPAGLSALWGAVLGGYLLPQEIGLATDYRQFALRDLDDDALFRIVSAQARYARKTTRDRRIVEHGKRLPR